MLQKLLAVVVQSEATFFTRKIVGKRTKSVLLLPTSSVLLSSY